MVGLLVAGALVAVPGCGKRPRVKDSKYMSEGEDAISKGQIRKAVIAFEKETELNPKNPAPYLKLALIYENLEKDPDKAKQYYEQYLERETNKAKRERVEAWRKKLDERPSWAGELGSPPEQAGEGEAAHATLAEELEATRRKLRDATRTNEEFAQKILELKNLEEKLDASEAALARLTKERDDLKKQVQAEAQALAALKDALTKLKAKHQALNETSSNEIAQLNERVATLEAHNKNLESERTRDGRRSLSKELDEARAALKVAQQKNVDYARQVDALQKRVAQLEGAQPAKTVTHVVQPGETLMLIALKYYKTKDRWREIYEANRSTIPNPDEIKVGQELIIPFGDSQ